MTVPRSTKLLQIVGAVAATAIGNPELTPFIAAGADELRREGANYLHDKIDGR